MADLFDRYDAFILDQFGRYSELYTKNEEDRSCRRPASTIPRLTHTHTHVHMLLFCPLGTGVLHNGVTSLEGAVACVQALHRAGKQLIILSNTSAPSDKALLKLPKLGFDASFFTAGAVTSGEEASRYILATYGSGHPDESPPCRLLMLTWDASDVDNPRLTALPEEFLAQCGHVALATSVEDADVLLLHGSEVWYKGDGRADQSLTPFITTGQLDAVDPILQACSARNLPMVCANPDNIVRTADGGTAHMPGTLAARYRQLVDTDVVDCRIFGKPDTEHFRACLDRLREQAGIPAHRVAHVGDSLHHDIAGAAATGIASIWITSSGIHANELDLDFGDLPTEEQIDALLAQEGTPAPTHVLSTFSL